MKLLSWTFTILFALAGLALRADRMFAIPTAFSGFAPIVAKGCFVLAILACPFLWARPDGLMPDALAIPGKNRLMMALALIIATPLILHFP